MATYGRRTAALLVAAVMAGTSTASLANAQDLPASIIPEELVNKVDHDEAVQRLNEPDVLDMLDTGCDIDIIDGGTGTELYGVDEFIGSGGYTGDDGNNAYGIFYLCRSTNSDGQGYKYAYYVLKMKTNPGTDNHVWQDWDICYAPTDDERTHKIQFKPGSGSLVDWAPENSEYIVAETRNLGVSGNGWGVSWDQYYGAMDVIVDHQTGAEARWFADDDRTGCGDIAGSLTTTWGTTLRQLAGFWAELRFWVQWNYHHENWANNHRHGIHYPCVGMGCGTDSAWIPLP